MCIANGGGGVYHQTYTFVFKQRQIQFSLLSTCQNLSKTCKTNEAGKKKWNQLSIFEHYFEELNLSYFIAKRLSKDKSSGSSALIIRVAVASVAISIAVMITALSIVKGYQVEIRDKITGFGSHIQISRLDLNNSYETAPLFVDTILERLLHQQFGLQTLQRVAIKAGIIKTSDEFQGVVLKGVDSLYDWRFMQQYLKAGVVPDVSTAQTSNDILLSEATANKLNLKIGNPVMVYFVQDPPRARRFVLKGIYKTGFDEMDQLYAFTDLRHIQRLNNWAENGISGYELKVNDFNTVEDVAARILPYLPYHMEINTIRQLQPQLFEWLGFLDLNALIIIILMIVVACINMTTALLILIVERNNMIGLLKAFGAGNRTIAAVFLNMATRLVLLGLVIGNVVGVGLCLAQSKWGWIKLSQDSYYLSEVPVKLQLQDVLFINIGSLVVCYLVLLLPSFFVSKITPVKAIRFE